MGWLGGVGRRSWSRHVKGSGSPHYIWSKSAGRLGQRGADGSTEHDGPIWRGSSVPARVADADGSPCPHAAGRKNGRWGAGGWIAARSASRSCGAPRTQGVTKGPMDSSQAESARHDTFVSAIPKHNQDASIDRARYTLRYGKYRLAYEIHGSGDRVLVWLHGLLLDSNLSRHLARALAARGNRVVLLDLLGHGHSDKPRHAGPLRMDLYAEQVVCLLDELAVDQAVLGGVSLGTNVSLMAAVAVPDRVRGLVLEMPVLESAVPAAISVFLPLLLVVRCPAGPRCDCYRRRLRACLRPASGRSTRSSWPLRGIPTRNRRRAARRRRGAHRPDPRPAPVHHLASTGTWTWDRPDPLIHRRGKAGAWTPRRQADPDPHVRRAVGAARPPHRRDRRVPRQELDGRGRGRPAEA